MLHNIYTIEWLSEYPELPSFKGKCSTMKNNYKYVHVGKPTRIKKEAKQNSARKIVETISNYYIFCKEKINENPVDEAQNNVIYDSDFFNTKTKLYKWTNSCEKCYQHGDLAKNCYGSKSMRICNRYIIFTKPLLIILIRDLLKTIKSDRSNRSHSRSNRFLLASSVTVKITGID